MGYWDQWSHSELMSMQGVEIDEFYSDDVDVYDMYCSEVDEENVYDEDLEQ